MRSTYDFYFKFEQCRIIDFAVDAKVKETMKKKMIRVMNIKAMSRSNNYTSPTGNFWN